MTRQAALDNAIPGAPCAVPVFLVHPHHGEARLSTSSRSFGVAFVLVTLLRKHRTRSWFPFGCREGLTAPAYGCQRSSAGLWPNYGGPLRPGSSRATLPTFFMGVSPLTRYPGISGWGELPNSPCSTAYLAVDHCPADAAGHQERAPIPELTGGDRRRKKRPLRRYGSANRFRARSKKD